MILVSILGQAPPNYLNNWSFTIHLTPWWTALPYSLYFLTFLGYSWSFILPEELGGYFIKCCVRIMLQAYIILERINTITILPLLIQKHGMPFILSKSSFMSLWQSNTRMFHCLPTFLRCPCTAVMLGTFD